MITEKKKAALGEDNRDRNRAREKISGPSKICGSQDHIFEKGATSWLAGWKSADD